MKIPRFSILDAVTVRDYETPSDAVRKTVEAAKYAESLGYYRYWFPEHHGEMQFASAAPAILIGRIAEATRMIRVGAGGVMLLNHSPLVVAEQFATLESLYPGRIDLGLGRAVGSDKSREEKTKAALLRPSNITGDDFERYVRDVLEYLGSSSSDDKVLASPGKDTHVPLYLLSTGGLTAKLAGALGLPFAYATHIAPKSLLTSIQDYHESFRPSATLKMPYLIVSALASLAETDAQAQKNLTSFNQVRLTIARGGRRTLPPPVDSMEGLWTEQEAEIVGRKSAYGIIGSRETATGKIQSLLEQTRADELIFLTDTYYDEDRYRSFAMLAEIMHQFGQDAQRTAPNAESVTLT